MLKHGREVLCLSHPVAKIIHYSNNLPYSKMTLAETLAIFFFHDESTFSANDDERIMWKDRTMQVLWPKGRGAGLMISDFIEERVDT